MQCPTSSLTGVHHSLVSPARATCSCAVCSQQFRGCLMSLRLPTSAIRHLHTLDLVMSRCMFQRVFSKQRLLCTQPSPPTDKHPYCPNILSHQVYRRPTPQFLPATQPITRSVLPAARWVVTSLRQLRQIGTHLCIRRIIRDIVRCCHWDRRTTTFSWVGDCGGSLPSMFQANMSATFSAIYFHRFGLHSERSVQTPKNSSCGLFANLSKVQPRRANRVLTEERSCSRELDATAYYWL